MVPKEMKIDVAAVAKQAFQERGPAEAIDQALLRVAKNRYGESGLVVFQAIRAARGALAKRKNVSTEEALQQLIDGQRLISLITYPQTPGADEVFD